MSKIIVKEKETQYVEMSWDRAIADAKQRIKDFQRAIETYQDAKGSGEPWPGLEGYAVTQELSATRK